MVVVLLAWTQALAGEVRVAVASNFGAPMQKLVAQFEQISGHRVRLALGATGTFYAQIKNGAPFDVLLAADQETPARIEAEGLAVPSSRYTYAVGQLVLWSLQPGLVDERGEVLRHGNFRQLALANPRLSPYGRAAVQTLTSLGLWPALQARVVQGDNIAQTHQFVMTGNATLGFVAWSQVNLDGKVSQGSVWRVPENLHAPIRQDAVLLRKGQDNEAARALMDYLRSERAQALIRSFGYGL
jgi:molybdate transport system substrate-binding protein